MKSASVKDFLKASKEAVNDLESNALLLGFFNFPHGNFEQIEKFERKVENWNRWISQLTRIEAGAALDMPPEAFMSLLERIENGNL